MRHPGYRSLALLEESASTARVLNLRQVALRYARDPELQANPFFKSPALNRAIIVKHHLRAHELDEFECGRTSATKVLLPIDHYNLRVGAKYFFVGQRAAELTLKQEFGLGEQAHPDLELLKFLDELPSFDPFLLREKLRSRGCKPSERYFDVSEADVARMLSFAQAEIQPLVDIAFAGALGAGDILARKILSDANDNSLAPLRQVLYLGETEFAEGVFCWKAFLYYKWRLFDLTDALNTFGAELANTHPSQRATGGLLDYIVAARANVHAAVAIARASAARTLRLYDQAYNGLIHEGDGRGFRDFLLQAPGRFVQLGQDLATLDHMVSFWRFRFPKDKRRTIDAGELAVIFRDFEAGLRIQTPVIAPQERMSA
jgi:hypothetical protein